MSQNNTRENTSPEFSSPDISSPETTGAPGGMPQMGYEQAREELGEVVRKLESGGVPLADSMALWERGEKLAAICQQWLDGARARIDAARAAQEVQKPQASVDAKASTAS